MKQEKKERLPPHPPNALSRTGVYKGKNKDKKMDQFRFFFLKVMCVCEWICKYVTKKRNCKGKWCQCRVREWVSECVCVIFLPKRTLLDKYRRTGLWCLLFDCGPTTSASSYARDYRDGSRRANIDKKEKNDNSPFAQLHHVSCPSISLFLLFLHKIFVFVHTLSLSSLHTDFSLLSS